MANLRRSLVINFFSSSGTALLQFAVSIILARILSPGEIGVFSMTIVFVNIAHVFRDFGVSGYLQREPNLTPDKMRSASGVAFVISWTIALILFLASPALGRWFGEPEIVPVMRVLSISFVLIPFGAITSALLAREFAAEKQAKVSIITTLSYCIACVTFAWLGYGTMSLAYANVVNNIVAAVAFIPFRPKNLPLLPSFRHWRSVAHFGAGSLLTSLVTQINNSIPDIMLGRLGNARQVGLLSRANSTVTIFTYVAGSTVSYGALSYLSTAYYRDESLVPILKRATVLLTGVGWTALALTSVLGRDIVLALYGPTWLECVPAILPLSLAAALGMMFHYIPTAVAAIGRPYLSAVPTSVMLIARIAIASFLFNGSVAGFAWVLCFATFITVPVIAMQQKRYLDFDFGSLCRATIPSLLVAAATAAVAALLAIFLPTSIKPLLRLLIMLPVLATVWYLMLRVTRHELVGEIHQLAGPIKTRLARLLPNV
jgi:O-antigen/teichoic acid export membrane protein